jgi:hypothetical protein
MRGARSVGAPENSVPFLTQGRLIEDQIASPERRLKYAHNESIRRPALYGFPAAIRYSATIFFASSSVGSDEPFAATSFPFTPM